MSALRVEIELPQDLVAVLNVPEADLSRRAMEWVILELFQEGEISSGKAAETLGLSKASFLDLLDARKLPYLDAEPGELERDFAAAKAAASCKRVGPPTVSAARREDRPDPKAA